ncbi:hypothetical protein [Pseudozobellia thermophila]|uniref:Uncharacterized protein n=1 Tax=Pseudozobellia thermophila TaxID=192903 RepID=A0A1M6NST5_9FLAO|nr:hypothetical protein [Pseudozobellia thermophila]SHJ98746.1 hypothetical protein SAMN04488513_11531 [Pseudozobellia thermophila]
MKHLFVWLALLATATSFGQAPQKVNLTEYIREIQKWHKENNDMSLAFWIPTGYWKIATEGNPQISGEAVDQIVAAFDDYVLVCGLDVDIHTNGTASFTDEATLRKSISLIDADGEVYLPLTDDEVTPEASGFLEPMKPMFRQMLGQMGEGMHFYFFKVQDENGKTALNEYQEGSFTIKHSDKQFNFTLPLVALMPPKKCPVDHAEMKGNWKYCPFHGDLLEY